MEISLTTKNSFVFFGFSSSVILSLWFFSTISIYWNSSYQAMALYECPSSMLFTFSLRGPLHIVVKRWDICN
ncbi:Membrane protein insertase YidC [Dirofilaria immitis]